MKFGKRYEQSFRDLNVELPPFPYRVLKKKIRLLATEQAELPTDERFLKFSSSLLTRLDQKWQSSVRRVMFKWRNPRTSAVLHRLTGRKDLDVQQEADRLGAWAELSREGLRKILKKYNKRCGQKAGATACHHSSLGDLAFVRGRVRAQLEALARAGEDADALSCPVCLEVVYQPVAPRCGHAVCAACYAQLAMTAAPLCPVCRGDAPQASRMPVLSSVARYHDPSHFDARKRADEAARQADLERRFASRLKAHPMAAMLPPEIRFDA